MERSPDAAWAVLLLTNRATPVDAAPLTARELWDLAARVDPGSLLPLDVSAIAELAAVEEEQAVRLRTLLDASTALAFEQERLLDAGISLLSAYDDRFPSVLGERLGPACPPFLLVAGPLEWLGRGGLAIVGSRHTAESALELAGTAARIAVGDGRPVVSGAARGVDQAAMAAALDGGGAVVGIPAEGIRRWSRSAEVRRRVHEGELCLASPYAPDAPFRTGNAMGRNKLVYALSRLTFVVATEHGTGGTWAGATEALDRRYGAVAVWTGAEASDGNRALARLGATSITDPMQLLAVDVELGAPPVQRSLF